MATAPAVQTTTTPATSMSKKIRVTFHGIDKVIDFAEIGPGDDLVARQQCGIPVTPFLDEKTIAADSTLILWWLARRKNGESGLRFDRVLEEFPTYQHVSDANPTIVVIDDDEEVAGPPA